MTGRRTLLVIASALCAALGTALVWLYVQGADARARTEAQGTVELRQVWVTTSDAAAGTTGNLVAARPTEAPADLGADAVTPAEVAAARLRVAVVAGTILRRSMFTTAQFSGVAAGDEAVSITINDPQRMPALLQQGDDVSVFAYAGNQQKPDLVVPHVTVRTIGTIGGQGGGVNGTTIGFETSPQNALKILSIASSGRTAALAINGERTDPAAG